MIMEDLVLKQKTISSIEISELTGKQHFNVMRDIRDLLEQGVAKFNFELGSYIDKNNQRRPCYNLTQKGCLILASGYDALLREKIINRWEELEIKEQSTNLLPQSFAEALRLAADQADQIVQQQQLLLKQKPKVLFADAVLSSDDNILVGQLSTILNQNGIDIGQNRLFKYLRDNEYLCKVGERRNEPTQKSRDLGIIDVKRTGVLAPDGTPIIRVTPKITPKGQIYFINKFLSHGNN